MTRYVTRTLHVYIRAAEGKPNEYGVSTTEPPENPETAHFSTSPDFEVAIAKLYARGADRVLRTIPDQDTVTALIGETLFRSFFTGSVLEDYRVFKNKEEDGTAEVFKRVALHLPRALYNLPWEVLRDPNEPHGSFLALEHSVIRVDGELKGPDPRYYRITPTIRGLEVLFVVSNPSDRPIGDFEPIDTEGVKFHTVKPATYLNFQSFTASKKIKPDGFVFLGHGIINKDANNIDYGALIFVKEQGAAWFKTTISDPRLGPAVGTDLKAKDHIRIGCLLACESAWISEKVPFDNTVVGQILIRTNIPYVLGAQSPISLFAAQEFLAGMVQALQEKIPLDFAIMRGRNAVHAQAYLPGTEPSDVDWWIPVLYTKATNFDLVGDAPSVDLPVLTEDI